jgi:hypothetical protein
LVQALWKVPKERKKERTLVKRLVYLATAALVAMLILVPTAMAQEDTMMMEKETTVTMEGDLPKSGGVTPGTVLLPAAALLVGGGILGYAVLRRR